MQFCGPLIAMILFQAGTLFCERFQCLSKIILRSQHPFYSVTSLGSGQEEMKWVYGPHKSWLKMLGMVRRLDKTVYQMFES